MADASRERREPQTWVTSRRPEDGASAPAEEAGAMTIRHHPSLSVRSDYVASSLAPGAALAVAAHLKLCPVCAIAVETMSGTGEQGDEGAGVSGGPTRSFAEIGATSRKSPREGGMFEALDSWRAGSWWFMGLGLRIAALKGVSGLGEAVHLLKARPGARLRLGAGVEHLLVLEGGFSAEEQQYKSGDFADLAGPALRHPMADAGTGCTLLVVSDDNWPTSRLLRFLLSKGRLGQKPA